MIHVKIVEIPTTPVLTVAQRAKLSRLPNWVLKMVAVWSLNDAFAEGAVQELERRVEDAATKAAP